MPIFHALIQYLKRFESVQNLMQIYQQSSGMSAALRWWILFRLYSINQALSRPSHEEVQRNAQRLIDQGVILGHFYWAKSLFLQNKIDDAENHINLFLTDMPLHAEGVYLLAKIKQRQHRHKEAFETLQRFLKHSRRGKTWQHLSNLVNDQVDFERFYELFAYAHPCYDQQPLAYDLSCHLSNAATRAKNTKFVLDFWRRQYRLLSQNPPSKKINPPVSRRYSDTKATQALSDLKHCFHQNCIEFFLISGTLLGCIREGKLLGHDKDIDVGVWEIHSVQDLAQAVYSSGCFEVLPVYSPDILVIRHVNGVTIDVFIHHRESNDYWHAGGKSKWHNSPFKLTHRPFLNDEYLIPEDYDRYLTENYGDWRTPKTSFDSALDTPNMSIISQDEFLIYLYKKITFALHSGSSPSERYLSVLREYGEHLD